MIKVDFPTPECPEIKLFFPFKTSLIFFKSSFNAEKKGNRPSYINAAKPELAIPLYEKFTDFLRKESGLNVYTGKFGADMKVSLINDGPVTIILDSKEKNF